MIANHHHTFHIPVMGLGFTLDTPVKLAHFGISSVVSIVEDGIIEVMRRHFMQQRKEPYTPILTKNEDYRAERICSYLNLLGRMVEEKFQQVRNQAFTGNSDIDTYFQLLPSFSPLRTAYQRMMERKKTENTELEEQELRKAMKPGSIDVNIMTKLDKVNYQDNGEELPLGFSDALAALRGFANSELSSSVVLSAGLNPRLYNYIEQFADFFPDENGHCKKSIILKVSDYRSAAIQGKYLAKKGIWISEFRVESGLNCGGHAFAAEGIVLGKVLQDFKDKRHELHQELLSLCNKALEAKGKSQLSAQHGQKITAQGGIGTAEEHTMLMEYYNLDLIGWGSPFLLVPEATSVDIDTLNALAEAEPDDYYTSDASPLGVLFNNFRKSTSHKLLQERIEKGRPGSACYKKFLQFNTEFTEKPICTASRQYQHLKIEQLEQMNLPPEEHKRRFDAIVVKECLCEGLGAPLLLSHGITPERNLTAVSICPGPNLAYFSGIYKLSEMIDHIYGRTSLLNEVPRKHVFLNELELNIKHVEKTMNSDTDRSTKRKDYWAKYIDNLGQGVAYYEQWQHETGVLTTSAKEEFSASLRDLKMYLENVEEQLFAFC